MNRLSFFGFVLFGLMTLQSNSQNYCRFLKSVQWYQNQVKLVKNGESPQIDSKTFSWEKYQQFFNRLDFDKSVHYKMMYDYDFGGGSPFFYALKPDFDVENYIQEKVEKERKKECSGTKELEGYENRIKNNPEKYFAFEPENKILNFVQPRKSKKSFLQYLFFSEFGESFCLFWHANYGQKKVLCCPDDVDYYIDFYEKQKGLFSIDLTKLDSLQKLNLKPRVRFKGDKCIIIWYEIWTHRGVYLTTYSVSKKPGFVVSLENKKLILPIQAEFIY